MNTIDPELRKQLGEDGYRNYRRELAITKMENALPLARLRCLPFDDLLGRLERIWEDAEYSEIIIALGEIELSEIQENKIVQVLIDLSQSGDLLDSKSKGKVDRCLARISKMLSPEAACKVVTPFLDHQRKARRMIAYKVLRFVPVTAEFGQKLVERHSQTGDQDLLEIVARSPVAVSQIDIKYLLSSIREEYWRARVIAALLITEPHRAYDLAEEYHYEFVHAVGRVGHKEALSIMKQLFQEKQDDIEFMSIYTWCLGVLGARKDLAMVERVFTKLKLTGAES